VLNVVEVGIDLCGSWLEAYFSTDKVVAGRSKVSSEDGNLIERGDKKSVLLSGFNVKILSKLENLLFEQVSFVEAIYICIDLSERGHRIVA